MSRILLVDDVRPMAEQYAYDLRRLGGHEVVLADNGADALAALERDDDGRDDSRPRDAGHGWLRGASAAGRIKGASCR